MGRNKYLVCYDVHDQSRLTHTRKKMKEYGEAVQYSVFDCELNDGELIHLKEELGDILNLSEDRVMIINIGSVEKSAERIFTMGTQIEAEETSMVI